VLDEADFPNDYGKRECQPWRIHDSRAAAPVLSP
jgi:hypothetical protein